MNGSELGDLGVARLDGNGGAGTAEEERGAATRTVTEDVGMDLPELALPDSALPIPPPPPIVTRLSSSHSIATHTTTSAAADATRHPPPSSPARVTPRTRFNLSGTPVTPHLRGASDIPLRPILNLPSSPLVGESPASPQHLHSPHFEETDITSSILERDRDRDVPAPPHSPVFAPRDDDEPHPEHDPFDYDNVNHEGQTPHPLYTPAPRRRRKRRRSKSVASSRTNKSGRSKLRKVWKTILRGGRKKRRAASSYGGDSSSSSSSSSSTSDSSGTRSSGSRSTWGGWRFWRNSSSGSDTSSKTSSEDTEDEWEPPVPHFTLLTPCLGRPTVAAYPTHLEPGSSELHPDQPSPATTPPDMTEGVPLPKKKVFDLASSATIAPALKRLEEFWLERRQDDCLAGDIGAGVSAAGAATAFGAEIDVDAQDEMSYFVAPEVHYGDDDDDDDEGVDTPGERDDLTPLYGPQSAPPPPSAGLGPPGTSGPHGRKLRGEERTMKSEIKRLGKRGMEDGPAWWLDVMCPSVADMKKLRKILPLHPLTMEDILHQETREKIEFFPPLGYYFVVFRALDETYFKYTSPDVTPSSSTDELNEAGEGGKEKERERKAGGVPWENDTRRGRVDIVEGLDGKEGVEGVGVGAVNIYLVVFGDGIITFHYEDISKHADRVQGKLQQFGISRSVSSHWIAYGLMDSIVDAFFPLVDFVEFESNHIDDFLVDPLNAGSKQQGRGSTSHGPGGPKQYDDKVVSIQVEPNDNGNGNGERTKEKLDSRTSSSISKATVKRRSFGSALRGAPAIALPAVIANLLPKSWVQPNQSTMQEIMMVDASGFKVSSMTPSLPYGSAAPGSSTFDVNAFSSSTTHYDRLAMLKRITDTRKLVTGLTRLLGPKADVVRGLRRRAREKDLKMFKMAESTHDITIYIGDLYDHIIAIQQTLTFYDTILSHNHPTFTGMMRLALHGTKTGIDASLVKLYIVTLTFLPMNIITGLFSENVEVPHNGDRSTHLEADGSRSPFTVFYMLIGGVLLAACIIWFIIWLIFQSSKRQSRKRKGGAHVLS